MAVQVDQWFFLEGTEEECLEILQDAGLLAHLNGLPDEVTRQQNIATAKAAAKQALEEIQSMPINQPTGEPSVIIKQRHLRLHFIVRKILVTGGRVALAYFLAPASAMTGALLAESFDVVAAIRAIAKAIRKLDDEELQVYEAMLAVIDRRRHLVFKEPGANAQEIQQLLGEIAAGAPNAAAVLATLKEEARVKAYRGEGGNEYFMPVW
jgi:hypothetical protein